jgi:hypothetical protein
MGFHGVEVPIVMKQGDIMIDTKSANYHVSGFSHSNSFLSKLSEILCTQHR